MCERDDLVPLDHLVNGIVHGAPSPALHAAGPLVGARCMCCCGGRVYWCAGEAAGAARRGRGLACSRRRPWLCTYIYIRCWVLCMCRATCVREGDIYTFLATHVGQHASRLMREGDVGSVRLRTEFHTPYRILASMNLFFGAGRLVVGIGRTLLRPRGRREAGPEVQVVRGIVAKNLFLYQHPIERSASLMCVVKFLSTRLAHVVHNTRDTV